jgi:Leucine-rich repeat (LRR) protein
MLKEFAGLKSRAGHGLKILVTLHTADRETTDEILHVLRNIGFLYALSRAQGKDGARPGSAEEVISFDLSRAPNVTAVGLKALADFRNLTTLHLLNLNRTKLPNEPRPVLQDEGLRVLREIGLLHALPQATGEGDGRPRSAAAVTSLDLTSEYIKITGAALKELAGLTNLTTLTVRWNLVSDAALRELRKIGLLHSLCFAEGEGGARPRSAAEVTSLDLASTSVTDAGLKELATLKNLTALNLTRTLVTDAGLKELAGLDQLRKLNLSFTKVTGAGFKELTGLKNLTTLWLVDTPVSAANIAELRKALPRCNVKTKY